MSKRYSSHSFLILFRPNFFQIFPVAIHSKPAFWNFEISNLNLKKGLKFNIIANEKMKSCLWGLGVVVTCIWVTFDLLVLSVILG